ncbi:DUF302 domain-containing protein [Homoserinimonas sp. OAct 916]|uniref:DUF302 domain-containing protein n=1 Tax=Homoserinimonas sp. OAct 916 TaxID=2211450 RepID=UPI000DBE3252|nr:DUF302 domain-containing protein [Homoserinimonas sp. OAct 916]
MSDYTITATMNQPCADTVAAVRTALADQGFGVLTEIDLKATLKAKLDVDIEPQIILGACRPALAYEAIQADMAIAAVLPCNVVVRSVNETTTVVEAIDPDAMMGIAANDALHAVAADAKQRLTAALASLSTES